MYACAIQHHARTTSLPPSLPPGLPPNGLLAVAVNGVLSRHLGDDPHLDGDSTY